MPVSARLAMWATAAVRGCAPFDDALDAVCGGQPQFVVGLPANGTAARQISPDHLLGLASPASAAPASPELAAPTRLATVLIDWRRARADVRVVLPVPGDVRGVPTAPDFLAAALTAGHGVYGGGIGLVPMAVPAGPSSAPPTLRWQAFAVDQPAADPLQLNEAEHELAQAMRETATLLRETQLGGVRGVDSGRLQALRRVGEDFRFAPGFAGRAAALVVQAERLEAMLDLADADSIGGAIDRTGISVRSDALRGLRRTVRRARLAGYHNGFPAVQAERRAASGE